MIFLLSDLASFAASYINPLTLQKTSIQKITRIQSTWPREAFFCSHSQGLSRQLNSCCKTFLLPITLPLPTPSPELLVKLLSRRIFWFCYLFSVLMERWHGHMPHQLIHTPLVASKLNLTLLCSVLCSLYLSAKSQKQKELYIFIGIIS